MTTAFRNPVGQDPHYNGTEHSSDRESEINNVLYESYDNTYQYEGGSKEYMDLGDSNQVEATYINQKWLAKVRSLKSPDLEHDNKLYKQVR